VILTALLPARGGLDPLFESPSPAGSKTNQHLQIPCLRQPPAGIRKGIKIYSANASEKVSPVKGAAGRMKNIKRKDNEPPFVIEKLGWRYHHLGIPTKESMPGERYLPHLKIYVSGFDNSPFGIEWMRFEDDCPIAELIKTVPHVAFEVDDLDKELNECGCEILYAPSAPSAGVRAAMIKHNGAPVELIEFKRNKSGM
jgi:hypothetical protein